MSSRLLMIEDDGRLAAMVGEYLAASGFAFAHAADGLSGLAHVQADAPDLVEVHLLDGASAPIGPDALYGQRLEVELVTKLRDERRFAGPEALRAQIAADCAAARAALASTS